MKKIFLSIVFLFSANSFALEKVSTININPWFKIATGEYSPANRKINADVLFLHGYGDTFTNHKPLFNQLNDAGLRVISFDYPNHGNTVSKGFHDLDFNGFKDLTNLAEMVLEEKLGKEKRPLLIMGWSTGGLLGIRMTQGLLNKKYLDRVEGLLTMAPGVSVKKCVGNAVCKITNKTLSNNPSKQNRKIKPSYPLGRVGFASALLLNAHNSWKSGVDFPHLVIVAGDNDQYVKSKRIKEWSKKQVSKFDSQVIGYQCPNAKHELDNEPAEFGGVQVRSLLVNYSRLFLGQEIYGLRVGPCQQFIGL